MKKAIAVGVIFGILCLFAATALGLGTINCFDFIFKHDYKALTIEELSGVPFDVALRNYRYVMKYMTVFGGEEFHLPDLVYSEQGAIHFRECRDIFTAVYAAGAIGFAVTAAYLVSTAKRKADSRFLKVSAITTVAVPALLLSLFAINFNAMFVLFHKIIFDNDFWLFDPDLDPVINLLPEKFFMHCAVFIALFWIAAAGAQYLIYRKRAKRSDG